MHEYRLKIGNAILGLWLETPAEAEGISSYFHRASSEGEPDLNLVIRFRDEAPDTGSVPNSLYLTKTGDGSGFVTGNGLISGRYSAASREGELTVQRLIATGGYARVFEQIFFQAYWSVVRQKGLDSFLLHSSGAIRDGLGFCFTGPSGTGKSTVVKLSRKHAQVLNDEIVCVDLGETPTLRDTPFNGFFTDKVEGQAPLAGILLLKQAPHHRVSPAKSSEAVKTLAREIIPPLALEDAPSAGLFMDMIALAEKARSRVPLYTMEFLPDAGFWAHVDVLRRMK